MTFQGPPPRSSTPLPAPLQPKGRGARSNTSGRFEAQSYEPFDDGWSQDPAPKLRTTLLKDRSKSIISFNDSPDLHFDRSVNPYRGCEHGCVYCYARPSHAYWGYSPGLDFESKIFYKPNAIELLEKAFQKKSYEVQPIMLGANTDAYQPVERQLRITRSILELCLKYRHPVGLITKSTGIVRDLDLLSELAALNLARAAISITTLDPKLARDMEPRAATPPRRLEALKTLADAGIPATVMMAPIIPGLTDREIEPLLSAAKEAGAGSAYYVLLRLPLEIRDLFYEWLGDIRPQSAKKIISLIRQTRDGKDYDSRFGQRQTGEGPVAEMIAQRFTLARKKLGLKEARMKLRTDLFQRPLDDDRQASLF